jgi:hypothetical protein
MGIKATCFVVLPFPYKLDLGRTVEWSLTDLYERNGYKVIDVWRAQASDLDEIGEGQEWSARQAIQRQKGTTVSDDGTIVREDGSRGEVWKIVFVPREGCCSHCGASVKSGPDVQDDGTCNQRVFECPVPIKLMAADDLPDHMPQFRDRKCGGVIRWDVPK